MLLIQDGQIRCADSGRYDKSSFILGHYVDGDLVDEKTLIARTKAGPGNLHIWGE